MCKHRKIYFAATMFKTSVPKTSSCNVHECSFYRWRIFVSGIHNFKFHFINKCTANIFNCTFSLMHDSGCQQCMVSHWCRNIQVQWIDCSNACTCIDMTSSIGWLVVQINVQRLWCLITLCNLRCMSQPIKLQVVSFGFICNMAAPMLMASAKRGAKPGPAKAGH